MNTIYYLIMLITIFCSPIFSKNEDLDLFGGQDMDKALEEFLKELQNLSPEDQKMLEDLGKEMEDDMKNRGLDPMNPDDILKWADVTEPQNTYEQPYKEPKYENTIKEPKAAEKPVVKVETIASTEQAIIILEGIIKHLASVKQKSAFYPDQSEKIDRWAEDLMQIEYFCHVLQSPDLLKHIVSKPYEKLYKTLESLYNSLSTNEPKIQIPEFDEDSPYTVLNLKPYSSQEQIDLAYHEFKNLYSEATIKNSYKTLPEKDLKKKIKEANLSLAFIEEAYSKLNNPKEKRQIDKLISQKSRSEKDTFKSAQNNFNAIISAINVTIFEKKVLNDIKQLLEKYKPEELEKAKAQEQLAKQILERSRQANRIVPSQKTPAQTQGEYDEFYKKIQQDKNKKLEYPKRKNDFESGKKDKKEASEGDKGSKGGPEKKGGEKKDEKKDDKDKKDDKKKDDKKEPKKDEKKKPSKKEVEKKEAEKKEKEEKEEAARDKEIEDLEAIKPANKKNKSKEKDLDQSFVRLVNETGNLLEQTTDSIEIEIPGATGAKPRATYAQIASKYKADISEKSDTDAQAIKDLLTFVETNNIFKIASSLKDIAIAIIKDANKTLTTKSADLLNAKILPHENKLQNWAKEFMPILKDIEKIKDPEAPKDADEDEKKKIKDDAKKAKDSLIKLKPTLEYIQNWFNILSPKIKASVTPKEEIKIEQLPEV